MLELSTVVSCSSSVAIIVITFYSKLNLSEKERATSKSVDRNKVDGVFKGMQRQIREIHKSKIALLFLQPLDI